MSETLPARKLAAILHADVVGYSRLMGEDEAATHRVLREYLDAIASAINEHQGRVVSYAGDAVLADFTTVTDALNCAVAVQCDITTRNETLPDERKVQFRIGINLGEVIVDREDIYGDGVNIAARIESLAEPGGICISESARSALGKKLPFAYHDMGEQQVKNIAEPVKAYRVMAQSESGGKPKSRGTLQTRRIGFAGLAVAGIVITLVAVIIGLWRPWEGAERAATDTRAIAVLPFDNLSADPEQEYFADGMTDDLITDLSKLSGLLVIARNAAFVYKGQSVNPKQVAEELGVRYVLEGSVRKAGEQVRINVQLVDAASGGHLWAERYDRKLTDIFDLQDEVIEHIVTALAVELSDREQQRLAERPTANVEAYDYFLRGQALLHSTAYRQARQMYRQAIAIDPEFARAYGALSMSHVFSIIRGQSQDPENDFNEAITLASKAKRIDDSIPQVRFVLSNVYLMNRQYDQALYEAQQAVVLDPGYADAYIQLAWIYYLIGDSNEAIEYVEQAMRFSPNLNATGLSILGGAYLLADKLNEAFKLLHAARDRNPETALARILLTLAYIRAGKPDEAQWEAEELLAISPDFSVKRWGDTQPYKDAEYLERLMDDLRTAGLPD